MPGLNRRPSGLESDALPTELISHATFYVKDKIYKKVGVRVAGQAPLLKFETYF
jgi:hypothetical protein